MKENNNPNVASTETQVKKKVSRTWEGLMRFQGTIHTTDPKFQWPR